MKKFKVLKKFKDFYTGVFYEVGKTYEVTKERFEEIQNNLQKHDDDFIQEVRPKKKKEEPSKEEGE